MLSALRRREAKAGSTTLLSFSKIHQLAISPLPFSVMFATEKGSLFPVP